MKKKWSRRRFLEAGLRGSIVVGGGAVAEFAAAYRTSSVAAATLVQGKPGRATDGAAPPKSKPSPPGFDPHARDTVRAAMDEIVPATDGMPAASEVGGVEYLERLVGQTSELKRGFEKGLAALEEVSLKRFKKDFLSLRRSERVEALAELEKQAAPDFFVTLRDHVYEAYYTQPQVWKLVGYEFHPADQSGPRMKPFDEAVLAEVRKKPKFYREVP